MDIKQLQQISTNFVNELKDAQSGKKTSLPFIVHELSKTPLVAEGETFQVIKIGGSILQKSQIQQKGADLLIKTFVEDRLPVFTTKDVFLSAIDKNLDPRASVVAINFAYPMKPVFEDGRLDGILIQGMKEHAFHGLVGQPICKTIELYVESKYGRKIKASVANDTICLTLAGLTKYPATSVAGGIVGTGMNFAMFLDDTHLVNIEAANFDKFPRSEEGKQIDAQSLTAGRSLFEKEVAGAYLHHHLNILLTKNQIKHPALESTHELDGLARGNVHKVSKLARELITSSAQLIACQVAGITEFMGHDMTFVMEGSLFWNALNYKETVAATVAKLTKHKVTFEEIVNCGIIGAAKLVT